MTDTFKNDLTNTIDALRENVKEKEALIDAQAEEILNLKVELGRCRAVIKTTDFLVQRAIRINLI